MVVTVYLFGYERFHGSNTRFDRSPPQLVPQDQVSPPLERYPAAFHQQSWMEMSEAEVLEEEMLRAGILASLKDAPEGDPDSKIEVPKSSVSSLRSAIL